MTSRPTPSLVRAAVATGVGTAAYYAIPDLVSSRALRGWAKAGLTVLCFAASVPELRATWATAQERPGSDGEAPFAKVFRTLPATRRTALLLPLGVVAAGAVGGTVWADRRAFRHGQARAAAGKRLPHTGPALLYGVLAAGLWFLPDPQIPRSPAGDHSCSTAAASR